jgi:NADP-dependent aldehyde dehydrogenase
LLTRKVGRLIFNAFPTGVEVSNAMVHGGPFPATTAVQSTSVGTAAIRRFSRPICYQGFPQASLPAALRNENPSGLLRLVDGTWTMDSIGGG